MSRRLALVAAGAIAAWGCSPPTVLRSAGGEVTRGRFIAPQAYEAYARGALAEAEGRLAFAAAAYRAAASIDDGPEPWTRLGAVLCKQKAFSAADEALAEAEEADETYAPLHRERARCLLAQGDTAAALVEADRALLLDPDDEETGLLRADILERAGDVPGAIRELLARLAGTGPRVRVAARLELLAQKADDEAAARIARRVTEREAQRRPGKEARAKLDAALEAGDLARARSLGVLAGVTPGALALRAAATGQRSLAAEQAKLVLGADPDDTDALVALLASAPGEAAPATDAATKPLSRLGRLVLAESIVRWYGAGPIGDVIAPDLRDAASDPLEAKVAARLKAATAP